jgi:t-SNARE complex subunit (syntaxin)
VQPPWNIIQHRSWADYTPLNKAEKQKQFVIAIVIVIVIVIVIYN